MKNLGRPVRRKETLFYLLLVVISFAPIIWLFFAWSKLPEQVPLHYNGSIKPDKMGSRNWAWVIVILLTTLSLLLPFFFQSRSWKNKSRTSLEWNGSQIIMIGIGLFLAILNLFFIIFTFRGAYLFENYGFNLIGTLIGLAGIYGRYSVSRYLPNSVDLPFTKAEMRSQKFIFLKSTFLCCASVFLITFSILLSSEQLFPVFVGFLILLGTSTAIYFMFR